jgi:type II secretory pathway pseudopilin PulG
MLKLKTNRNRSAGDTLIEVLFAVTVFSLIVVTSLSLMNQGVSAAQRSLEITTVRQQMDGQVETLRFLHEAYVQAYQAGQTYNLDDATTASPAKEYYKIIKYTTACQVPNNRSTDFILNPVSATLVTDSNIFKPAETFSQLSYGTGSNSGVLTGSNGMWIEAVRSGGAGASSGFIDFHVRACWDAPGLNSPMNLGTIVRLYEPLS